MTYFKAGLRRSQAENYQETSPQSEWRFSKTGSEKGHVKIILKYL
jgi:hypothetical protein